MLLVVPSNTECHRPSADESWECNSKYRPQIFVSSACVTLTERRGETDKWPVFVQELLSHDVASIDI